MFLVPADKEGGFTVLEKGAYNSKALAAISSVFVKRNDVCPEKVKREAHRLCRSLDLETVCRDLDKTKGLCLRMFFSAKTHKEDCPFRVIISEKGCWQETVARFLRAKLKVLTVDDPFMISSSDNVIDFLKENTHANFSVLILSGH